MDTEQSETGSVFRQHGLPILFTALVSMFTGAAYLTGLAYYQTYLHVFHVSATLVPISSADHFVYAYAAINFLGQSIFKSATVLAVIVALIVWGVSCWLVVEPLNNWAGQSQLVVSVRSWLLRYQRIRKIALMIFVPTAIAVCTIYLALFVVVVLIVPVELGGGAGRLKAHEDLAAYRSGCTKPVGPRFCNSVSESGKQLGNGYIIGGSEKNIIIFDGTSTSVLPRSDKTTVTEFVPAKK